jgi:ectoine hydroxylase-related dioxygenase (phytanoyl-CoA dioxygenase family)
LRAPNVSPAFMPSGADRYFYRRHGWYISGIILPTELLDGAAAGVARYLNGERDYYLPAVAKTLDRESAGAGQLSLNAYTSLQMRELRALVSHPNIGRIASVLAGGVRIRLFRDQLIIKPPTRRGAATTIGWHVDRAYWPTCSSNQMLTAWIPLHDCDEQMGTLTVLDGSHLWPENLHLRTFDMTDLNALVRCINTGGRPVVEVPLKLLRGQVSFHHCCLVHGSRPNRSKSPRISLAVHLQDEGNHYLPATGPAGQRIVHLNDLLCRRGPDGLPDYSDAQLFPALWPPAGPQARRQNGR